MRTLCKIEHRQPMLVTTPGLEWLRRRISDPRNSANVTGDFGIVTELSATHWLSQT